MSGGEPPRAPGVSLYYWLGAGSELHPELWRYAPVVQHDVGRDGANVQLLLERWERGGRVKDCFPPGERAALAEVRRLRKHWSQRYAGESGLALRFADWMDEQVRAEYGAPGRFRVTCDRRLRRVRVRGRERVQPRKRGEWMSDELAAIPDPEAMKAEREMFASVLEQAFLGVLAKRDPEAWYETAARRLSRGSARKLLDFFDTGHAAGSRQEPRAAALGDAIQLLCEPNRKAAGPYDFPTELAVLVVSREAADAVLKRVHSGFYNSPDEVVATAMHAIEWAENDPLGKSQLLKYALAEGIADDAGRDIPAHVIFSLMRDRLLEAD